MAQRCNLRRRKAFSAAFCTNFVTLGAIASISDYTSKEGLLLQIPFFREYSRIAYFNVLDFPWSIPFAMAMAAAAAFVFRFAILFFRDKVEISLGERRISFGETQDVE